MYSSYKILNLIFNLVYIINAKTNIKIIFYYILNVFFKNLYLKLKNKKKIIRFKSLLKYKKYKFTISNILNSIHLLSEIDKNKKKIGLILGCFEGQSALYFLNNQNINRIYCVDIWNKSLYQNAGYNKNAEIFFNHNLKKFKKKIVKIKTKTENFFKKKYKLKLDFCYIDANHYYLDVLNDAENSWRILKKNGILIFNAILYRSIRYKKYENNLTGINMFLKRKNYKVVLISSNILVIEKV
jgi:predicted O-methyltransferase YrrM